MICKIADFIIDFQNSGRNFHILEKVFGCIYKNFDVSIRITKDEALTEKIVSTEKDLFLGEYAVYSALRKFSEWLPLHDAFLLHSACFDVNGIGVAFAAHSGTGKTTHMLLWQKLLGDKMTVVNGDKPIVRFFEDEPETPYAYGTPWCGKEHLGCNMRTPLKHICFIERADKNSCEPIDKSDAVNLIFNQVYMPKDPAAMMKTMQLIDRLLSCCKLWKIKCNMEPDAAETSFNAIFGKETAMQK